MKDFLKYTLATVVGILVVSLIVGVFSVMTIVGMVASADATKEVKDNSVLVLNLSGQMQERAEGNPLGDLVGGAITSQGLDNIIEAINRAKTNDNVKGIYIEAGLFTADSYASMQALRRTLSDFKKSGKWIVAYADTYTQATYYLSSVANKVYLNPQGQIDWHGLAAQPIFYKDLMAKFGVKMQLAKVGTYKSAPEMFTADKMSDANREQVKAYISGIWENICKEVGASRSISTAKLNEYADGMMALAEPQSYISNKMVDKLLYTNEVKSEVKKMMKIDADDEINQISVNDMLNVKRDKREGEEIAVYYAIGDVVDGNLGGGITSGGGNTIDAQKVCRDLENLMNDDDVKAVVLRINSGGGSAYASEQIWHSMKLLKAKKPVVVSMGGMAASGAYYISCISNWIVSEPTTLTGSIGIFGMFPDFSGLITEKLGVKFDEVKTNRNAGFGTMARPFNEEEMRYLNSYVERGYKLFRHRVAEGRKMTEEQVEKVAQGHVWLGQDAVRLGLVDELGGLDKAVSKAAKLAKLKEYYTFSYPSKSSWMDVLLNSTTSGNYLDEHLKATLGDYYEPFMLIRNIKNTNAIQARVPFSLNVK